MHCNIAILTEVWILAQRSHVLYSHTFLDVGGKLFSKGTESNTPSTVYKIANNCLTLNEVGPPLYMKRNKQLLRNFEG